MLYIPLLLMPILGFGQGNLELYRGNESYLEGDFDQAQSFYRESLNEAPGSFDGTFNLGNTYYRKQDINNAISHYQQAIQSEADPVKKSRAYHNVGNAHLQSQKIDEAIEAYKNALRINPNDDETRYNLAYAQRMKRQQQKQEQNQEQQEDQEQQQDQKQDQQKKDQKDEQDQEKQQDQDQESDQEKEQDEGKPDDQKQPEPSEEDQAQGKPERPLELSPREAEQLLEAARNEDEKTLMQMRKKKGSSKQIEKDW